MPRKVSIKSKLIKTERYKILSKSFEEPGLKHYLNKWKKTNKIILIPQASNGLSVVVKTYKTVQKNPALHRSLYISCLCCSTGKESEMLSIHLLGYGGKDSPQSNILEVGGKTCTLDAWQKVLGPLLGFEVKDGIKL